MILTIDIGNTRIKSAVFENNTIINSSVFSRDKIEENILKILSEHTKISNLIVASVGKTDLNAFNLISKKVKIEFISTTNQFPFQNKYETPETLGIDRYVLASGAVLQFPNQNRLVIDAGTCVTYDFIDAQNVYYGGAISPGIRLRYEAMHNYTAKLPLLTIEEPTNLIGSSTKQSLHSGVINGLTFEIDGYIDGYIDALKRKNENFIIILTGGDSNFLAKRLKNTIFANSNFLLESLNQLYQYQK